MVVHVKHRFFVVFSTEAAHPKGVWITGRWGSGPTDSLCTEFFLAAQLKPIARSRRSGSN